MRSIVMFDLPIETKQNQRDYRHFVKFLKSEGFVRLQKSIYTKLEINQSVVIHDKKAINAHLPMDGYISILTITEKQFQSIENLLGESSSKEITVDSRYIEL